MRPCQKTFYDFWGVQSYCCLNELNQNWIFRCESLQSIEIATDKIFWWSYFLCGLKVHTSYRIRGFRICTWFLKFSWSGSGFSPRIRIQGTKVRRKYPNSWLLVIKLNRKHVSPREIRSGSGQSQTRSETLPHTIIFHVYDSFWHQAYTLHMYEHCV